MPMLGNGLRVGAEEVTAAQWRRLALFATACSAALTVMLALEFVRAERLAVRECVAAEILRLTREPQKRELTITLATARRPENVADPEVSELGP